MGICTYRLEWLSLSSPGVSFRLSKVSRRWFEPLSYGLTPFTLRARKAIFAYSHVLYRGTDSWTLSGDDLMWSEFICLSQEVTFHKNLSFPFHGQPAELHWFNKRLSVFASFSLLNSGEYHLTSVIVYIVSDMGLCRVYLVLLTWRSF